MKEKIVNTFYIIHWQASLKAAIVNQRKIASPYLVLMFNKVFRYFHRGCSIPIGPNYATYIIIKLQINLNSLACKLKN